MRTLTDQPPPRPVIDEQGEWPERKRRVEREKRGLNYSDTDVQRRLDHSATDSCPNDCYIEASYVTNCYDGFHTDMYSCAELEYDHGCDCSGCDCTGQEAYMVSAACQQNW